MTDIYEALRSADRKAATTINLWRETIEKANPGLALLEKIESPVIRQIRQQTTALQRLWELADPYQDLAESVRRAVQPLQDIQTAFAGALVDYSNYATKLRQALEPFHEQILNLDRAFKKIPNFSQEDIIRCRLILICWPIDNDDTALLEYMLTNDPQDSEQLDQLMCEYYFENDWERLRNLCESWKNNSELGERLPILQSCLQSFLKLSGDRKINVGNAIIPALVSQLEGIRCDKKLSKSEKEFSIDDLPFFNAGGLQTLAVINEVFKGSSAFVKEKREGINRVNLNRNKINHGSKKLLDYGSVENVLRLFMMIDAAIKLEPIPPKTGEN